MPGDAVRPQGRRGIARLAHDGPADVHGRQAEPRAVREGAVVGPLGLRLEGLTPIERTRMYIVENFAEDLDLERLALVAQMSKFHFARQFKAETGCTCMRYLSQVRLSEAAKLFASTRKRVSEVCFEVGFGDLTHFERQFKRDTGCTPSEYRKRFRRLAVRFEG